MLKMTEPLAHWYSSDSDKQELSNEYQHDWVWIVIKHFLHSCTLVKISLSIERVKQLWEKFLPLIFLLVLILSRLPHLPSGIQIHWKTTTKTIHFNSLPHKQPRYEVKCSSISIILSVFLDITNSKMCKGVEFKSIPVNMNKQTCYVLTEHLKLYFFPKKPTENYFLLLIYEKELPWVESLWGPVLVENFFLQLFKSLRLKPLGEYPSYFEISFI